MTDAIEKTLHSLEINYGGHEGEVSAARAEVAALRADLADTKLALEDMCSQYESGVELCRTKDRQIAALREALAAIKRHQEIVAGSSLQGMSVTHKIATDALDGLAVPPSSMRLVPLEGLQEIADLFEEEKMRVPDWLTAAIAGKETPPPACDTIR